MLLRPRLLYLVSFDATQARTTEQVAVASKALGAPVYLLAVSASGYDLWRSHSDNEATMRDKLERVADRLTELRARVGHTMLVKGNRAVAAMEAAQRTQAQYILLGAGEQALHDPQFVRTTAKTLARTAEPHVWICKPQTEPVLDHILCAYNDSRGAAAGIRESIELARQFNAKMQLFSALPPPPAGILGGEDVERAEAQETAARGLKDQRESVLEGFNFSGVTLARDVGWSSSASNAILEQASKHHDGLLVMGAAGRRRFPAMMLGNTAEKILRSCPSSLLVVK